MFNKFLIGALLCSCLGALVGNSSKSENAELNDKEDEAMTTTEEAIKEESIKKEIETPEEDVNVSKKIESDESDEEDSAA